MPLVYAQLHAQARRYMRSERADATLQSTALVHEVYLRLTKARDAASGEPTGEPWESTGTETGYPGA